MKLLAALLLFGSLAMAAEVQVYVFVRTDCPITNRYAPELARIANEFHVTFFMVYAEPSERAMDKHMAEFKLPGTAVRDPDHSLEKRAHATVAPEAAVFDANGNLKYHGRIDDLYISPGLAKNSAQIHDLEDAIAAVVAGKPVARPQTRAIGCSLLDLR